MKMNVFISTDRLRTARPPAFQPRNSTQFGRAGAWWQFLPARKLVALAVGLLLHATSGAAPVPLDTEFRYTGFLTENGNPANGNYDFEAALNDAEFGGNQVGQVQNLQNVPAVNGVFQFLVNFGSVFEGTKLWLGLRVKPSNGNNWTIMSPRQLLTATPYALFAPTAGSVTNRGVTGPMVQDATLTALKIAGGEVVKSLNGLHDDVKLLAGTDISIAKQGNDLEISVTGGSGSSWSLSGNGGTTAGLNFLGTLDYEPLELRVNRDRALRLEPATFSTINGDTYTINVIGGHAGNYVASGVIGGTIAGGGYGSSGSFAGIVPNLVSGDFGTVGGGFSNRAEGLAMVGGGRFNNAGKGGFIGGGATNVMKSPRNFLGTIAGGSHNTLSGSLNFATGEFGSLTHATIGGGFYNTVTGDYGTIPGGYNNEVFGQFSLAAGRDSTAQHDGCFVWSDSISGAISGGPDQFVVKANGGMRLWGDLYFNDPNRQKIFLAKEGKPEGIGVQDHTVYFRSGAQAGNVLGNPVDADGFAWYGGGSHVNTPDDPGAGGLVMMSLRYDFQGICCKVISPCPRLWVRGGIDADQDITAPAFRKFSDRNMKTNIEELDERIILDQVLSLPITRWSYTNTPAIRHIGPMAQDFGPRFEVGNDDRHIDLGDEGGVALAAIQGLNLKFEELLMARSAEIEALRRRNDALELRLAELERVVATLVPGGPVPGVNP
jgi:hypothetical protein